jgi:hypothetical protein
VRSDRAAGDEGRAKVRFKEEIPIIKTGFMNGLAAAPCAHGIYEHVDAAVAIQNVGYEAVQGFGRSEIDAAGEQVILAEVGKDFGEAIGRTIPGQFWRRAPGRRER